MFDNQTIKTERELEYNRLVRLVLLFQLKPPAGVQTEIKASWNSTVINHSPVGIRDDGDDGAESER